MGNNSDFLGSHVYVGRNHFYNNGENAIDIKEMTDVVVSENVFNNFRATASSTGEAAAIHFGPRRIWFINNTIYDSEIALISTGSEEVYFIGNVVFDVEQTSGTFDPDSAFSLGTGIHVRGSFNSYILNNTIYNYDMAIQVPNGGPTYIFNNIMAKRRDRGALTSVYDLIHSASLSSGSEAGNNLYFPVIDSAAIGWGGGNAQTVALHVSQAPGSVEGDPMFLDPENPDPLLRDFALAPGSIARDAGEGGGRLQEAFDRFKSLYGVDLTRDIKRFPRVQGTGIGIGAVEFTIDTDSDGIANVEDPDDDGDGVEDGGDAFPLDGTETVDTDADGTGNNSDTDDDNDGTVDTADAFPLNPAETLDTDSDGTGNNADTDDDGDGRPDATDVFPLDAAETDDADSDGTGNNADTDDDNDGIPDNGDAFPFDDTESLDTDGDGIGNNADADDDGDGVPDATDTFPLDGGENLDTDNDGVGNNVDTDDDDDGVPDTSDAFPLNGTETIDSDSDGIGNNSDPDDDNDGAPDVSDAFPFDAGESVDTDGDGTGNNTDTDDDGDGEADATDDFPLDDTEVRDYDSDGTGDNADLDDDNDGVNDTVDAFMHDATEWIDTDGDGTGNNADVDDDNDGVLDSADLYPLVALGNRADTDLDGAPDDCDAACSATGLTADDDDDSDGVRDPNDAFPKVSLGGLLDTDLDGRPDNCDTICINVGMAADPDDDNDGVEDEFDVFPSTSLNGAADFDHDGIPDDCDAACMETGMIADDDDDNDGAPDSIDPAPNDPTITGVSRLQNISTRGRIQTGDEILIGGVIIGGTENKDILIRARGPSLAEFVPGTIADPTIDLFSSTGLLQQNDDWQQHTRTDEMPVALRPTQQRESAILITVAPGAYTAIVRGINETEGIGIVEIFEILETGDTRLLNISTRGFVGTGDNVLIGGVIVSGSDSQTLTFRARGPSMAAAVPNLQGRVVVDPYLQLFDATGTLIDENNNWQDHETASNLRSDLVPSDPFEAALTKTLAPGAYTVIVRGIDSGTGIGIVEAFEVD